MESLRADLTTLNTVMAALPKFAYDLDQTDIGQEFASFRSELSDHPIVWWVTELCGMLLKFLGIERYCVNKLEAKLDTRGLKTLERRIIEFI